MVLIIFKELSQERHIIPYSLHDGPSTLAEDEQKLLDTALTAAGAAYAPFSQFHVGCAVQMQNGDIMTGNNQENPAYPSSLCAERTILYYAGSQGRSQDVRKLAIRAYSPLKHVGNPVTPCGACRQVMLETERLAGEPLVVLMQGADGKILRLEGVAASLLPFGFDIAF